jgi:hypothetical protein
MTDVRPSLDAVTDAFGESAIVTAPGSAPVTTVWVEQGPVVERFPSDSGTWSLRKSRRRGSLRLDHLPVGPPGVSWPPPGTTITIGAETLHVEGVDYQDDEVVHVIVR